jgi:Flp pilus assembly protein TadG
VRNSSLGRPSPRRAAAAAEIALLGSVLALVLVITIDFARLFFTYVTITNSAYAGAMYASQGDTATKTYSTDTSGTQAAAVAEGASLSPALSSGNVTLSSVGTDANNDPCVSVTVTYSSFTTLITYPGVPHTMTLTRTVEMRVAPSTPGSQN